jgi:uracil-DNA glycosylase
MIGPAVAGEAVVSPVMLIGQAPGVKEGPAGKPFAWTAGKTLLARALKKIQKHEAWRAVVALDRVSLPA